MKKTGLSPFTTTLSKTTLALLFSGLMLFSLNAKAADWSSSNVQLLYGTSYELGDDERLIFTYENALGWAYGDSFIFIDVTEPQGEGTTFYSEFSPRFSLSKIMDKDMSGDLLKDVMIASTFEMGDGLHAMLVGVGLPMKIDGFAFFDVNLYLRQSTRDFVAEQTDLGAQVTLVWKRPFTMADTNWIFEGFFDLAFAESGGSSPKEDNIVTAPRLLMDLGSFDVGIEYQIWRNKFGIDGVDEDVIQFMVKAKF